MSIVFAAITPHPPVLISEIGKSHLRKLSKTKKALQELEHEFYSAQPDSVLVISPHGQVLDDAFTINFNPEYVGNFKEFGDHSLEFKFKSDAVAIQKIRAGDETQKRVPLVLSSQPEIDHGFTVPLSYLTPHLKNIPLIPVTPAGLDYQHHFGFGQFLQDQLVQLDKRIAVIASADLSHKLTKAAPDGYSAQAADFDKNLLALIKAKKINQIVGLDPTQAAAVGECGVRPIVTLLGIIGSMNFTPALLSYEGPFGVGYPVVNFSFQ